MTESRADFAWASKAPSVLGPLDHPALPRLLGVDPLGPKAYSAQHCVPSSAYASVFDDWQVCISHCDLGLGLPVYLQSY